MAIFVVLILSTYLIVLVWGSKVFEDRYLSPIFCSVGNTHHIQIQHVPIYASRAIEISG